MVEGYEDILRLLQNRERVRCLEPDAIALARTHLVNRVDELIERHARKHPLGFVMISESVGDGVDLRYHVWPENWPPADGQEGADLHDHIYDLSSIVVAGSIRQETLEAVPDPQGDYQVFEVQYSAAGSAQHYTGRSVRLDSIFDDIFSVGMAYRLSASTVHRVEVLERPAATLVLTTRCAGSTAPLVFVPTGQPAPSNFDRGRLSTDEVEAVKLDLMRACREFPKNGSEGN
jgi:hypothetical protein